jgi:hypothetical protein
MRTITGEIGNDISPFSALSKEMILERLILFLQGK